MNWAQILQAAILLMAAVCLGLFAKERERTAEDETPSLSSIFSNPFLRVLGILLMLLVVLQPGDHPKEGAGAWLPSLGSVVVLIIGATVAGADFILLLTALLKGNNIFIKEHFALERARSNIRASEPVKASAPKKIELPAPTHEAAAAGKTLKRTVDPLQKLLEQPAMVFLEITAAQQIIKQPKEVRVAVLSTGIDSGVLKHPAFQNRLEPVRVVSGAVTGQGDASIIGTANSGSILAIAPSALILPIALFNASLTMEDGALDEALRIAVDWGPQIIFMDFGGSTPIQSATKWLNEYRDRILFVAPGGNGGNDDPSWPAAEHGVMGVAAVTSKGELAAFSSFGRNIRFAAPGVDVSCLAGAKKEQITVRKLSGTSMAAAVAVGVAALGLASRPDIQPADLMEALANSSTPVSGHRSIHVINAKQFLSGLGS